MQPQLDVHNRRSLPPFNLFFKFALQRMQGPHSDRANDSLGAGEEDRGGSGAAAEQQRGSSGPGLIPLT